MTSHTSLVSLITSITSIHHHYILFRTFSYHSRHPTSVRSTIPIFSSPVSHYSTTIIFKLQLWFIMISTTISVVHYCSSFWMVGCDPAGHLSLTWTTLANRPLVAWNIHQRSSWFTFNFKQVLMKWQHWLNILVLYGFIILPVTIFNRPPW